MPSLTRIICVQVVDRPAVVEDVVPPTPEPSDPPSFSDKRNRRERERPSRPDSIKRPLPPKIQQKLDERPSVAELVEINSPPPAAVVVEENQVVNSEQEPQSEQEQEQEQHIVDVVDKEEPPAAEEKVKEEQYSQLSDDVLQSRRNAIKGVRSWFPFFLSLVLPFGDSTLPCCCCRLSCTPGKAMRSTHLATTKSAP